ncbi:MAG: hypothetical protein LBS54_06045 [Dysgonamonadaceae bacterium]|jgi:hypothetical protein|nr:hypothetical protein [Dysgonamonadaceae bacterium]
MKVLFISLLILIPITGLHAQVTIGSTDDPAPAALLDLKEHPPTNNNVTAETGGLLLPRVKLSDPTVFGLTGSDGNLLNKTGMLVYNVNEKRSKGLVKAIYQWTGDKWELLRKVTTTGGSPGSALTKKVIYESLKDGDGKPIGADPTRTVSIGRFEFRLDRSNVLDKGSTKTFRSIPQIRIKVGESGTFRWYFNQYWDLDLQPSGQINNSYSFEYMNKSLTAGNWTECTITDNIIHTMSLLERNEMWLFDHINSKIYNVQFLALGNSTSDDAHPKTYAIIAREY